ncbi:hypothetical protein OBV_18180 [Oscillibacter valericigenes Sjm18-20]|nr:hypothetical protein OBV_18180 [Oscillibacter valericigenes Sjm18-20]
MSKPTVYVPGPKTTELLSVSTAALLEACAESKEDTAEEEDDCCEVLSLPAALLQADNPKMRTESKIILKTLLEILAYMIKSPFCIMGNYA